MFRLVGLGQTGRGLEAYNVQDSEDPNPLIRALAIRTMGCIRVDKIVEYLEEPLRKTLRVRAVLLNKIYTRGEC